jgi:hypothetical protein
MTMHDKKSAHCGVMLRFGLTQVAVEAFTCASRYDAARVWNWFRAPPLPPHICAPNKLACTHLDPVAGMRAQSTLTRNLFLVHCRKPPWPRNNSAVFGLIKMPEVGARKPHRP